jgi:nicotinamide-nucleotide amidase
MSLEKLAQDIGSALKLQNLQVATAESCTGGGLAYWITSVAGSSAWFERGFVTYSNQAKIELLGVNAKTLEQYGAVSEATAREMAEAALKKSQAAISIAITGIAGPEGGTKDKPLGTVFIAIARHNCLTDAALHLFQGTRQSIREQTIQKALEQLLKLIT